MSLRYISAILFTLCAACPSAYAESCLPSFTSLDVFETLSPETPQTFSHRLRSQNTAGLFDSEATLEGKFDGETLTLQVRFDVNHPSLPYVLSAVLVTTEKRALSWQDLTHGCRDDSLPQSIFPGGSFSLSPIKLEKTGSHNVHIFVWGRM